MGVRSYFEVPVGAWLGVVLLSLFVVPETGAVRMLSFEVPVRAWPLLSASVLPAAGFAPGDDGF
jgi:hypothetical protein